MKSVSGEDMVTYDSRVQSYWQVPEFLSFMLQLLIFLFLALAGMYVNGRRRRKILLTGCTVVIQHSYFIRSSPSQNQALPIS